MELSTTSPAYADIERNSTEADATKNLKNNFIKLPPQMLIIFKFKVTIHSKN